MDKRNFLMAAFLILLLSLNVNAVATQVTFIVDSLTIPGWGSVVYTNPDEEMKVYCSSNRFEIIDGDTNIIDSCTGTINPSIDKGDTCTVMWVRQAGKTYNARILLNAYNSVDNVNDEWCQTTAKTGNNCYIYRESSANPVNCPAPGGTGTRYLRMHNDLTYFNLGAV